MGTGRRSRNRLFRLSSGRSRKRDKWFDRFMLRRFFSYSIQLSGSEYVSSTFRDGAQVGIADSGCFKQSSIPGVTCRCRRHAVRDWTSPSSGQANSGLMAHFCHVWAASFAPLKERISFFTTDSGGSFAQWQIWRGHNFIIFFERRDNSESRVGCPTISPEAKYKAYQYQDGEDGKSKN